MKKFNLEQISKEQSRESVNNATVILSQADNSTLVGALLATADIVVNLLTDRKHNQEAQVAAVFELAASQVQSCRDDESLMGGGQQWSFIKDTTQ